MVLTSKEISTIIDELRWSDKYWGVYPNDDYSNIPLINKLREEYDHRKRQEELKANRADRQDFL